MKVVPSFGLFMTSLRCSSPLPPRNLQRRVLLVPGRLVEERLRLGVIGWVIHRQTHLLCASLSQPWCRLFLGLKIRNRSSALRLSNILPGINSSLNRLFKLTESCVPFVFSQVFFVIHFLNFECRLEKYFFFLENTSYLL